MRKRLVLVLFVVAAVAVAGCTSSSGSGSNYGDTGGETGAPTTDQSDQQTAQGETQDGSGGQKVVEVVSGASPDRTIQLNNYDFSQTSLQIEPGTVVEFVNAEGSHTVTLDTAGIDRTLSGSQSVTLRFNEGGTYQVYCKFHGSPGSGMHSNVQVGQSSGSTDTSSSSTGSDSGGYGY